MNLFNNVSTRIELIKAGFSRNPAMTAKKLFTPRYAQPPQRNSNQWADLFMKSPRMAPIHKIACDVAVAQYKLYKDSILPENVIKDHVFLKLMKKPCPNTELTEFYLMYLTEVYRLLPSGEAFWLLERNGLGVPSEIWIVPPFWVIHTPTESIPYFQIMPQGNTSHQMLYVEPWDMIWFKEPDPLNPYGRGRGRAEGVGDEIETDEYMAKWAKKFFFNDAVPHMVGMMPGAGEDAIDRQQERWDEKYGGFHKNSKTAWINWDAKFQLMKETNKEMDFSQSRKDLRDACNSFWNMAPELFGILENSNRSTIELAYELYAKNVFSIRLRTLDDILNTQLLPQFDSRLVLGHDNVVPADKEYELKKSESGLKNGGITVDEWRVTNGYDPLPDGKGQILYTPLNMMPTDLNRESIIDAHVQETQTTNGKTIKAFSDKKKEVIWKVFDKAALKYERSIEKACKKYFQTQQDRVTKGLAEKAYQGITKDATDNPDDLTNWTDENDKLKDTLEPYWTLSMTAGFNLANDTYNLDLIMDLFNPKFKQWVEKIGLNRAKLINDTTKEKLRKTIADGIEAGESIPKLRDRVSSVYDEAKKSRATLIARTETVTTVNAGAHETYKEAGVEKKEWLATMDSRTRDAHRELNGEVVDIDNKFSNGLQYPCEPNCRCTILPVLLEE